MQIVRTQSAGVFAGEVKELDTAQRTVVMTDARRLWYWSGAASLSELALRGPANPSQCKFPAAVDRVQLFEVIEILDVTEAAQAAINAVPEWTSR